MPTRRLTVFPLILNGFWSFRRFVLHQSTKPKQKAFPIDVDFQSSNHRSRIISLIETNVTRSRIVHLVAIQANKIEIEENERMSNNKRWIFNRTFGGLLFICHVEYFEYFLRDKTYLKIFAHVFALQKKFLSVWLVTAINDMFIKVPLKPQKRFTNHTGFVCMVFDAFNEHPVNSNKQHNSIRIQNVMIDDWNPSLQRFGSSPINRFLERNDTNFALQPKTAK